VTAAHDTTPFTIRPFEPADEPAVIRLWHRCGLVVPQNDPHRDILAKLAFQPELFFVGTMDERVIASLMAGYEGHRGWINYLAVDPKYQRQGIGGRMMVHAETALHALGCPKINLQVRESNQAVIAFYQKQGFSHDRVVSLGKRLEGVSHE
jgi:ribosomal protein S18 acetylase RimI-like enzyme